MSSNLEARSLLEEWRDFDKGGGSLDLGHPLLNRIAHSFVKAAGIGAVQAVAREACLIAVEGTESPDISGVKNKKHGFPDLRGETNRKSLEAMTYKRLVGVFDSIRCKLMKVKNTGKESLQWGLAAGLYSSLIYGLKEARGAHDWRWGNYRNGGTLTCEETSHEQAVQCAITGAALSTAANLLTGIF